MADGQADLGPGRVAEMQGADFVIAMWQVGERKQDVGDHGDCLAPKTLDAKDLGLSVQLQ